jgi:hypothetical protein
MSNNSERAFMWIAARISDPPLVGLGIRAEIYRSRFLPMSEPKTSVF